MSTISDADSSKLNVSTKHSQDLNLVNSARTLSNLPIEVLIKITENLCAHCMHYRVEADMWGVIDHPEEQEGKKALQELCLVARKFSIVAQPILHHYYFPKLPCYSDANIVRLVSLLRTITNRADLANSVKILLLDSIHNQAESQDSGAIQLNQTAARILDEISRQAKILPSLERPVALLKTLIIAAASESLRYLSDGFKEDLAPMPLPESITSLPRLQVFNLCVVSPTESLDYSLLKTFHNLEVFKISSHSPDNQFGWPAKLATGPIGIPNFRKLISENMGLDGLYTFLLNYPKLRNLEIFLNTEEERQNLLFLGWKERLMHSPPC